MLYKPGTMFEWDFEWFDYVIVNDQDEADIALADGWTFGKPEPVTADAPAETPRRGRPPKNKDAE